MGGPSTTTPTGGRPPPPPTAMATSSWPSALGDRRSCRGAARPRQPGRTGGRSPASSVPVRLACSTSRPAASYTQAASPLALAGAGRGTTATAAWALLGEAVLGQGRERPCGQHRVLAEGGAFPGGGEQARAESRRSASSAPTSDSMVSTIRRAITPRRGGSPCRRPSRSAPARPACGAARPTCTSRTLVGPVPVGVPGAFQDLLAAQHPARVGGQALQDVELLGRQRHLVAGHGHLAGPQVHRERPVPQQSRRRDGPGAARPGSAPAARPGRTA